MVAELGDLGNFQMFDKRDSSVGDLPEGAVENAVVIIKSFKLPPPI